MQKISAHRATTPPPFAEGEEKREPLDILVAGGEKPRSPAEGGGKREPPDVLVVGGGAAGLLCAGTAASRGKRVLLLERMERPGRKLLITGKGRCNLCNNCDADAFLAAINSNARFLHSAWSAFSAWDVMELFKRLGVPLKTERGGRVFPVSDKSADIVDALVRRCANNGVVTARGRAHSLIIEAGRCAGVRCVSGKEYRAGRVVLATGGMSYPLTGSTGDGYDMAKQAGHAIVAPRASLVPIELRESWCRKAMGLSLKNIVLTLMRPDSPKPLFREMGELLFTHFGVSGPLVLSASAHIEGDPGSYILQIDLKPALTPAQLDARLLRDFGGNLNRDFANALSALLPRALIGPIVRLSGIEPERKVHQITREERGRLAGLLKELRLRPKALRPIGEAVVTRGGVDVAHVSPSTMESKLLPGLFFAGELLDLDARTGGFNLQIAFSTGFLAGMKV